MAQKFILDSQMKALIANGKVTAETADGSHLKPVVKFFNPAGAATWLISEIAADGDTLFGLCDLGVGSPELGYVSLSELQAIKGRFGLGIERDMHFEAQGTMEQYANAARRAGHIVERLS